MGPTIDINDDLGVRIMASWNVYSLTLSDARSLMERIVDKVQEHFIKYVRDVINPACPEGYGLEETCFVEFNTNGFEIITGNYKKQPVRDEYELDIIDKINRYQETIPWVTVMHKGFLVDN